jgi:PKHD-type hydroxylase
MESAPYYRVQRGLLTAAECSTLMTEATTAVSGRIPGYREVDLFWVSSAPYAARMAPLANAWGFELHPLGGQLQLSRYTSGQRYDWHMDLGLGAIAGRKVTLVVQLSPRAQGGGLEVFPMGDLGLEAGDAVSFPSYIMHRAAPANPGPRWSLAAWFTGPAFR